MERAKAMLAQDPLRRWTVADALEMYGIQRWGCGYFTISEQGNLIVTPRTAGGNGNGNGNGNGPAGAGVSSSGVTPAPAAAPIGTSSPAVPVPALVPVPTPSGVIDMRELIDELTQRGIQLPILLRFSDILRARIELICGAFNGAIKEYGYQGQYRGVYPIKVNQNRTVVEEIIEYGRPFHYGLEAGSKPELLTIMAIHQDDGVHQEAAGKRWSTVR
jgi:arginine decarboxylase